MDTKVQALETCDPLQTLVSGSSIALSLSDSNCCIISYVNMTYQFRLYTIYL
jgi:hypothetical protein